MSNMSDSDILNVIAELHFRANRKRAMREQEAQRQIQRRLEMAEWEQERRTKQREWAQSPYGRGCIAQTRGKLA